MRKWEQKTNKSTGSALLRKRFYSSEKKKKNKGHHLGQGAFGVTIR